MTTPEALRKQFEKETGLHMLPNLITREYVDWLESKLTPKEKPNPLTKPIIDYYFKWYEGEIGHEPKLSKGDAAAAKELAIYLTKLVKNKTPNPTSQQVVDAFAAILYNKDKWGKFYQGQLKLSQINSNITNIIANIKGVSGKPKQSVREGLTDIHTIMEEVRRQEANGLDGK